MIDGCMFFSFFAPAAEGWSAAGILLSVSWGLSRWAPASAFIALYCCVSSVWEDQM